MGGKKRGVGWSRRGVRRLKRQKRVLSGRKWGDCKTKNYLGGYFTNYGGPKIGFENYARMGEISYENYLV